MSQPYNVTKAWRTGQFPLTLEQDAVAKEYARLIHNGQIAEIEQLSKAIADPALSDFGQYLVALLKTSQVSDDKVEALFQTYIRKAVKVTLLRKELKTK